MPPGIPLGEVVLQMACFPLGSANGSANFYGCGNLQTYARVFFACPAAWEILKLRRDIVFTFAGRFRI